ncbi:MAG: type IV secretion system DNA-binding domain-containing protein [Pirellulales bacterium]|nr:type IV secretion system DNA-binding domain-containing protein [Pirellulales bacterium]
MLFKRKPPPVPEPGKKLAWGRHQLDDSEATGHFLAVAASGGGKSTLLQLLMQSSLGGIGIEPDSRALVYDHKQDILPLLSAIAPHAKIVTSHPFDKRGAAWKIARDVTNPAVALETARTLFPDVQDSQPFFADAARHLLYGVMLSFILSGEHWTFASLLRVMQSARLIRRVLRKHGVTRSIEREYFGEERTAANIMSTVATKLLPFTNIAASWETAAESFSIEDWVRGNWILVLGNYETGRMAIDAVNRCLFKRASDLVLNQSNSFTRRTWFLWDEISEAGKLDGLVSLMKKGRSKGACCVLAFQSVQGLRRSTLYGREETDEILGQIANRWFGRLECVETAEWASELFGDQEFEEESVSESTGNGGKSRSVSRQRTTRRLVLPSEFLDIDACNLTNGLSGYYIVRSHGSYFDKLEGAVLWGKSLIAPRSDVPEFVPRPSDSMLLKAWSAAEDATFCVPKLARKSPEPRKLSEHTPDKPPIDRSTKTQNLDDLDAHFQ